MSTLWTDPPPWSWVTFGVLCLITVVLTVGFLLWMMLQPEEPEFDTTELVEKITRHDQERAATIRRRLDADTGRADAAEPELR